MQEDSASCKKRFFLHGFLHKMVALISLSVVPFLPLLYLYASPVDLKIGEDEGVLLEGESAIGEMAPLEETQEELELGNAVYILDQEERTLLARTVYSEARGENFDGQVAIAAVVLNRLKSKDFPDDIVGIIFQPKAFTAVKDGQFWLEPDETSFRAVEEAVKGVDPTGGALYYYNPHRATSKWIFTRKVIKKIGRHNFAI
ncbi:MAG: hypothetical protein GX887_00200 [Firmicutes bacterium]|nr:hypothetical protein [Bacillota bacterium]